MVGKEGQSTVWLSHRGILIAVSPEHLSLAHDQEVHQWMVVAAAQRAGANCRRDPREQAR